jgi:hypothetical protein
VSDLAPFFAPAPDLGTALPRPQDATDNSSLQVAPEGAYRRVTCDCGCGRWALQARRGRPLRFLTADCYRRHRRGRERLLFEALDHSNDCYRPRVSGPVCRCESCRSITVFGRGS